jgi:hypothetical protein
MTYLGCDVRFFVMEEITDFLLKTFPYIIGFVIGYCLADIRVRLKRIEKALNIN